nr:MAG: hypothetical protein [Otus scops adenovirus]
MTQLYLTRAVSQINLFHSAFLYRVHESLSTIVAVRCVRVLRWRAQEFYIVNCIIRLQCALPLYADEKGEVLHAVSRRLFFITPTLEHKCEGWLKAKRKFGDYKFVTTGLMIRSAVSLKMALRTMSYEVSDTAMPRGVPFYKRPLLFLNTCRSVMSAGIIVRTASYSSAVTQPVFMRSMLKTVCPGPYWETLSKGLCYMVGFREECTGMFEQWTFHVHGDYGEKHDCPRNCKDCKLQQPLQLFSLAQFAVIRNLFLQRRAHVTHDRGSPFF